MDLNALHLHMSTRPPTHCQSMSPHGSVSDSATVTTIVPAGLALLLGTRAAHPSPSFTHHVSMPQLHLHAIAAAQFLAPCWEH